MIQRAREEARDRGFVYLWEMVDQQYTFEQKRQQKAQKPAAKPRKPPKSEVVEERAGQRGTGNASRRSVSEKTLPPQSLQKLRPASVPKSPVDWNEVRGPWRNGS
jgi:hypothetical protein